jgi:hypothetical protein
MSGKEILGLFSILLSVVGHGAYFWSIWKKRTKPHAFSWIIWSLLTGIGFFAQLSKGAGAGAWAMGYTSVACMAGAILALFWGEKDIRKSDVVAFVGGLSAIPLWYFTKDPLNAVIVIVVVEVFAFYPTIRKSYFKPHEELAFAYVIDVIKYIISLFAMEQRSFTAELYPLFIIVFQSAFVAMLFYRRALKRVTR